jgi:serine protease Do
MMIRLVLLVLLLGCMVSEPLRAQSREEKVRNDKKKVEAEGYWIYNNLPQALQEAKESGKPIIAVLRCLPCEECVKLDDELIDADERMKPLLEQFVRVRIVSTNGLDLSLFQFDTDQSFAVFLLNADGTIYGRFGTRSDRTEWIGDVSIDGLAKALKGALTLHKNYPENKSILAAKRGPTPEFASPEKFPTLEKKYKATLDYEGKVVQSCIHCHQIGDAIRDVAFNRNKQLPETILFPYPHPKAVGLILDPKEMATVLSVEPKSPAESAGFQPGDVIETLNGQPLLSIADVQWVLQQTAPEGAELKAVVLRKGKPTKLTLSLEKNWRQRDDIAWRASSWELRRVVLGGIFSGALPDEIREKTRLSDDSTALLVKHVGQYSPHDLAHRAGVKKGDIIVGINGRTDIIRETDLLAERVRNRKPGEKLELTLLRDGKKLSVTLTFPK